MPRASPPAPPGEHGLDVMQSMSSYLLRLLSPRSSAPPSGRRPPPGGPTPLPDHASVPSGSGCAPPGHKVLLLDHSTTAAVSSVLSQTDVLRADVCLVSRLDVVAERDAMSHLACVCFVRPTPANVRLLEEELRRPKYGEYHLFFTNVLARNDMLSLAEADGSGLVRQVQEFYGDFVPVSDDLATLNSPDSVAMSMVAGTARMREHSVCYRRNLDGLRGLLLSLRRKPGSIRYQQSSPLARSLAKDIHEGILSDQIYHFRTGSPLLLVLDRMDDPVTPLLSQWTYQAMVHELIGINHGRVTLAGAPGVGADLREVVLSPAQDEFFRENAHANFGELGERIKSLIDDYQRARRGHEEISSIEDMQNFLEKYPTFVASSHNVSKHVAVMGELARLVDVCSLMEVSRFEQELACADDHAGHLRELLELLNGNRLQGPDKLRLGLLYALRYEGVANLAMVKGRMAAGGVPPDNVELLDKMLRYAGNKARGPGLYGRRDVMGRMARSLLTSVQGVSNVYSQHVPMLMKTVQSVAKGELKEADYPFVMGAPAAGLGEGGKGPSEIIVFMAGGTTYEEATKVAEFNRKNQMGIRLILGGSTIHNSTSFLEELRNT